MPKLIGMVFPYIEVPFSPDCQVLRQYQFGHGGKHLRRLERFNHPSLGTSGLTFLFFSFLRFGGEHDDGRELVIRKFFNLFDEGNPIHVGHVHIADNEMDFLPVQFC